MPGLSQATGRTVHIFNVGGDVSKSQGCIAITERRRHGEVRYVGEIEATPAAVERFVRMLEKSTDACILLRSRLDRLRALLANC